MGAYSRCTERDAMNSVPGVMQFESNRLPSSGTGSPRRRACSQACPREDRTLKHQHGSTTSKRDHNHTAQTHKP
eukprot:5765274-Pyramimonas_sp.AAC.1